jgi:hypothetical protein
MTRKAVTTKDIGLCWHSISEPPQASPGFEIRYEEHLWQKYLPKGTVFEFEELKYGMVKVLEPNLEGLSTIFPEEYKILNPSKGESNNV